MVNQFLKFSWVFALLATCFFVACDSEVTDLIPEETVVESFVDESLYSLQEESSVGRFGCFELVFPITVEFSDGTTTTANDYEELGTAIQGWKEENPDATGRPTFVFPVEVITEEGEVVTVNSKEELFELKKECGGFRGNGPRGHSGKCTPCFKLVFPITIEFPDGTTSDANDRMELKELVRTWKEENPDATDRPVFVFPIDVEMEDGTIVTVNSIEELKELRKSCN